MPSKMRYPNLIAEMKRYGITQRDLARVVDRRPETVSKWMNNATGDFTIGDAVRISRELFGGVSVDYLFSAEPYTPADPSISPRP